MNDLFTIGYATKDLQEFIRLLLTNNITCLADVRTSPYSKQFPSFNRETLESELKAHKILYAYFGNEFGARRTEESAYTKETSFNGEKYEYVDFRKVQNLTAFEQGCKRIKKGLALGYRICFMCSEKYPYDCHRAVLVGNWFYENGYSVKHIIDSDSIVSHDDMLQSQKCRDYFKKCKIMYVNKYEHDYDLLGNRSGNDEFFAYWDSFFKQFNEKNLLHLLNLKIGYKKGSLYD